MKRITTAVGHAFEEFVCHKRDKNIVSRMKNLLTGERTVLDVGCFDGRLSKKIQEVFGLRIHGLDVFKPRHTRIPVSLFDGEKIPFPENSFDSVFLIDVLHHTKASAKILKEALRVAKHSVIIKDHYYENVLDLLVLKIADFCGNSFHGISTPFYFKSSKEWKKFLGDYKTEKIVWNSVIFPPLGIPQIMYKISKA